MNEPENEPHCVLLVDDDRFTAELAGMALEQAGFRPLLAEGGLDALEKLDAEPAIRVVVSDLHMPLVDGLEFHREMRLQGHEQPFVLLSGKDASGLLEANPGVAAAVLKDENLSEALPEVVGRLVRGEHGSGDARQ
jgi:CheY-like chemotaxis protein